MAGQERTERARAERERVAAAYNAVCFPATQTREDALIEADRVYHAALAEANRVYRAAEAAVWATFRAVHDPALEAYAAAVKAEAGAAEHACGAAVEGDLNL